MLGKLQRLLNIAEGLERGALTSDLSPAQRGVGAMIKISIRPERWKLGTRRGKDEGGEREKCAFTSVRTYLLSGTPLFFNGEVQTF